MAHAALPRRSAAPAPMGLAPLPRLALPSQHPANAEQVIFFAAHGNLSVTDTRLLAHYSLQLAQAKRVAMWVLLYRPEADGMDILPAESAAVGVPVAAWGDGTLRRGLPLVAAAIRKDAGLRATPNANHQRYFWFHCSLRLWELSFGHAAARPRFWWRAEMDVLFAGTWPWLLERTLSSSADLLLPSLVRHDTPSGLHYPHWARNRAVIGASPTKDWVYGRVRQVQAVSWESPGVLQRACATRAQWERLVAARSGSGLGTKHRFFRPSQRRLVSVGRYSARFLDALSAKWDEGWMGYEEISLPMLCQQLGHERCQQGAFHRLKTNSWRKDMMV